MQEWPEEVYPNYANGPGYVISSDIARYIVSEFDNQTLRVSIISDLINWVKVINRHGSQNKQQWLKWFCFVLVRSCLRWRMWTWACGWRSSTRRGGRWRSGTTCGSTSRAATMATSRHTTSPRSIWSACGGSCSPGVPGAAMWDDDGGNLICTANSTLEIQRGDRSTARKHSSLMRNDGWRPGGDGGDEFGGVCSSGLVIRWFVHSFGRWPVSAADSDSPDRSSWSGILLYYYYLLCCSCVKLFWPRNFDLGELGWYTGGVYKKDFLSNQT